MLGLGKWASIKQEVREANVSIRTNGGRKNGRSSEKLKQHVLLRVLVRCETLRRRSFFFLCASLGGLGLRDNLFRKLRGNNLIVRKFHGVITTTLSHRSQRGSVDQHFCHGDLGFDDLHSTFRIHSQNPST